jgi:hypothetical protein
MINKIQGCANNIQAEVKQNALRLKHLTGSLEGVGALGDLCGWALDPIDHDYRVPVFLFIKKELLGIVYADRASPGFGNGFCRFSSGPLAVSKLKELNVNTEIYASFDAEGKVGLAGSPLKLDTEALQKLLFVVVSEWEDEIRHLRKEPENDPAIFPHKDVILDYAVIEHIKIIPHYFRCLFRGSYTGGIYRQDGSLELEALYSNSFSLGQLADRSLTTKPTQYIDSECLYGGIINFQYGHFIIESLSRFRSFHKFESLPIIFMVPNATVKCAMELPKYILEIFEILNVSLQRILLIREDTLIKKLIISKVGARHWDYLSTEHQQALAMQVKSTLSQENTSERRRKVYLSRSELSLNSHGNIICCEAEFENYLRIEGFTVIYPEKLTVKEQIQIFCSAKEVVGFLSSAFHTLILCPTFPDRIFYLKRKKGGGVHPQFIMID